MDEEDVHNTARELLKEISDVPLTRLKIGEALFLFRRCLREGGKQPNVLAAFDSDDLEELIDIVRAVRTRGGPKAIN